MPQTTSRRAEVLQQLLISSMTKPTARLTRMGAESIFNLVVNIFIYNICLKRSVIWDFCFKTWWLSENSPLIPIERWERNENNEIYHLSDVSISRDEIVKSWSLGSWTQYTSKEISVTSTCWYNKWKCIINIFSIINDEFLYLSEVNWAACHIEI